MKTQKKEIIEYIFTPDEAHAIFKCLCYCKHRIVKHGVEPRVGVSLTKVEELLKDLGVFHG